MYRTQHHSGGIAARILSRETESHHDGMAFYSVVIKSIKDIKIQPPAPKKKKKKKKKGGGIELLRLKSWREDRQDSGCTALSLWRPSYG